MTEENIKQEQEEIVEEPKTEEAQVEEVEDVEQVEEEKIITSEDIVKELEMKSKVLKEENIKLNNELDAMKEKLLRLSAEYENFRKRTSKEKEGIYTDACADVLKEILPVVDNLERAATVDGSIEELKKGIEMTLRQVSDSLSKIQVEEVATDIPFDPNLHNAVMHIEDEEQDENKILEVFQKGYKRGDKVIRHSMVKVAN